MPYRCIFGATILIVLHVLHARAISKSRRSLNESQLDAEEDGDIVFEEETFRNLTCRALCNAQWKNDFEACFQLPYHSDLFALPLHPLLTSSLDNFERYCNLTEKLLSCFSDQCHEEVPENDWTPGNHLCLYQKKEFIDSFRCMNLTNAMAAKKCDLQCETASSGYRNLTKENVEAVQLNFTAEEEAYYNRMTFQCHHQFCHFECQKRLIKTLCSKRDRERAIEFLVDYITWDMDHTLRALEDEGKELLFPEFCHRLLPEYYEFGVTDIYGNSRSERDPVIQLLSSPSEAVT